MFSSPKTQFINLQTSAEVIVTIQMSLKSRVPNFGHHLFPILNGHSEEIVIIIVILGLDF